MSMRDMTTRAFPRLPSALALAAVVLLTAACGDDSGTSGQASPSTVAKAKAAVEITSPSDGATVSSPVKVTMAASNFTIEPVAAPRDGAGHFHVMVDTACLPAGQPIPVETAGYNHFGKAQTETSLDLAPGRHTLCLQAGNGTHTALDLTDQITVTVTGA